jgi:hypothetical protein
MSCGEMRDRLDDYVDGELPADEVEGVRGHLTSCASCRAEERALRGLLAQAASLPKTLRPGRDLWPEIASELGVRSRVLPFLPRRHMFYAGAAAALLVAFATLRPGGARGPAPSAAPMTLPAAATEDAGLKTAEADYDRATGALLAALKERRESLSPEVLAGVEKNLAVIDQALAEVRQALDKDPGSPELTRMLAATHRKKVEVLQRVVKLSTSKS